MSAALVNEAHRLYNSVKTPFGPWTHTPFTDGYKTHPDQWVIRDVNGSVVALVQGTEETARMIAALPDLLDADLGAQPVGKSQ